MNMRQTEMDWAQKYAQMDERIQWKYKELPSGEQVGKRVERHGEQGIRPPAADVPSTQGNS
jgi:hypothetical protein